MVGKTIYYHTSVDAGGDVAFARQVSRGRLTATFTGRLDAVLDADADLVFEFLGYTFATQVLGGRLTLGALGSRVIAPSIALRAVASG